MEDVTEILSKFRLSDDERSSEILLDQLNQAFWSVYEDYRILNDDNQERSMSLEQYLDAQRIFHDAGLLIIEQITKREVPKASNDDEQLSNVSGQPSSMDTRSAANQDAVSDEGDSELLIVHESSDDEMMSSLVNDSVGAEKVAVIEQIGASNDAQSSTGAKAVVAAESKVAVPKQRKLPVVDKCGNRTESDETEEWRDFNSLPYLQCEQILRPLFQLPTKSDPNVANMNRVLDAITMVLKQAADLHVSTVQNQKMLIALIQSRMDETSRQIWLFHLDAEPTLNDLVNFLMKRSTFLKAKQSHCESVSKNRQEQREQPAATSPTTSHEAHSLPHMSKKPKVACACCGAQHYLHRCDMFKALKLADRAAVLKRKGLCMNCFSTTHKIHDCRQGVCRRCNVKHNSLLCSRLHSNNL